MQEFKNTVTAAAIAIAFTGLCVPSAEAKLTKLYYLKSGQSVWAFKSKAACEARRADVNARTARFLKSVTPRMGRVVVPPPAYCLDFLPQGYERPVVLN
jgi:hypothetical protein